MVHARSPEVTGYNRPYTFCCTADLTDGPMNRLMNN